MVAEGKKPFYKKWWFWVIVIIFVIGVASSGGETEKVTEDTDSTMEVEQATSNEKLEGEVTEEKDSQTEPVAAEDEKAEEIEITEETADNTEEANEQDTMTRDNASATETTLNAGTFMVGEDIPAGRYVITGDKNGNLFVYDGDLPVVNEILDPSAEFGVESVTTDIEDGQEIEISGINAVTFTPAETKLSNSLSTGTWIVGLDIESGRYDVTTSNGSGNFFVYNAFGMPEVNEILDASGEFGVPKVTVNLEEGQFIEISGLNKVEFKAK